MLPESIGSVLLRPGKAVTSMRGGGLVPAAQAMRRNNAAGARQGLPSDPGDYNVRPAARTKGRISRINSRNFSGLSDCGPSERPPRGGVHLDHEAVGADGGRGLAAAARIQCPVAWLGSTMTGRWVSS